MAQNPPANAGEAGLILSLENALKEEIATHSSFLAWKITCTEEPGRLQSIGSPSQTQMKQFRMHELFAFLYYLS